MIYRQEKQVQERIKKVFPLKTSPLVQCITNEITSETMANALLFIGAKPVMAEDIREFPAFFAQNDSLVLNLGQLSERKEQSLLEAAKWAENTNTPAVIDLVGVAATQLRLDLAQCLATFHPTVIKGNTSEMGVYCGLESIARGVDANHQEQSDTALLEMISAMRQKVRQYPDTVLLATGKYDVIVSYEETYLLDNGVPALERFTGTGDIVGALVAAVLGAKAGALTAAISAVSYFNLCGEIAEKQATGLADFRQETMNQLSLVMKDTHWVRKIQGGIL